MKEIKEGSSLKKKNYLSLERLRQSLMKVKDPRRRSGNYRHQLVDIFAITLLAVICGCETWEEIQDYGRTKKEWLETFLGLRHGIPGADTFRRLFERIKPEELERMYREWVTPYVGSCMNKQINIDGKTVRGAGTGLHMVSAWIREDGVTLGQIKTDEKSNEITAIPELLETFDITGGIVTIDAMGCQRKISEKIIGKEADYILAVKMNQPTLYEEIEAYFQWALDDKIESKVLSQYETAEKGHGRISRWRVTVSNEVSWFESMSDWVGLKCFIMEERKTIKGDKQSFEKQYYISSLDASAERFHHLVRNHWSIENQLHWVLDATFSEDRNLIAKDHSPQNLSLLRKIALAMLKKDSSHSKSSDTTLRISASAH
jgi:predicted transposase YbfD/YdcC